MEQEPWIDPPMVPEIVRETNPMRTKPPREMFVPNTDNSNKFGKTYLQKQSPWKSKTNTKLMKSESPVPGETQTNSNANLNSHVLSQPNIQDVAPTTGGYNISMVIAANTS